MDQESQQEAGIGAQAEHRPAPPVQHQQMPKSGSTMRGCLIAIVVVGILGLLGLVGMGILLVTVVASGMGQGLALDAGFRFEEVTVGGKRGSPKVVCLAIEGIISGGAVPGTETGSVALFSGQLKKAARDGKVRGVILYVDSPGGGITASDIMYRQLVEFRKGPDGKPVVACLMDVAASGAYYVSAGADEIIAHPTTITGSIGVMMPLYDATGLLKKIGIKDETITTGAFKRIGSPFAEKNAEQKDREHKLLGKLIGQMHERFVAVVAEGRGMELEEVRALADGRIFTSQQALDNNLIDRIGYESDAVAAIKKLAKISDVHLVRYRRIVALRDLFATFAKGPELTVNVGGNLAQTPGGRPMFLWVPPSAARAPETVR